MKRAALPLATVSLMVAAAAPLGWHLPALQPYALPFLTVAILLLAYQALRQTFYRSGTPWPQSSNEPGPLRIKAVDYAKAMVCWLFAFKRTYVVRPGLYYTGTHYDRDAPLLVTGNYHLSVLLVSRHVRRINARLLVIDTDGINVWCAAGKGAFCNAAILAQLNRYQRQTLTGSTWLTLLLPKFSLAGVDFRALRKEKLRPIIGPLYAKDLPAYLASPPYRDNGQQTVRFDLQMRTFSWLPGLVQFVGYSGWLMLLFVGAEILFGATAPLGLLVVVAFVATAYPLLFPWLPGKRFAVKGLALGLTTSVALIATAAYRGVAPGELVAEIAFTVATGMFFGLSYTGNSAVSNYTKVRRETAQFLVPNVLLYVASLVVFFVAEFLP